jgi:hypothetical protein
MRAVLTVHRRSAQVLCRAQHVADGSFSMMGEVKRDPRPAARHLEHANPFSVLRKAPTAARREHRLRWQGFAATRAVRMGPELGGAGRAGNKVATGDTVILTASDSNDSNISVRIPKE